MARNRKLRWMWTLVMATMWFGVATAGAATELPAFDPNDFTSGASIDNPYLPMTPGTVRMYEGEVEEDGVVVTETNEVFVTFMTKEILGVTCRVVRDTEWVDGELIEQTFDWYAQDDFWNIWYLGEDATIYEDGEVVGHAGSWEAGVDGAQPGYLVKGNPLPGQDPYYQEYYPGVAEDTAQVLSLSESVSVAYGDFDNCLQTLEWNPLELPLAYEHKFYASGVGLVQIDNLDDDSTTELISVEMIPEPATLWLIGLGTTACLRRARRRTMRR